MNENSRLAMLAFIAFWVILTSLILLVGKWWTPLRAFRACMIAQWKPALVISVLFLLGMALGGTGINYPYALAVFCQAMIGLALVRGVPGMEPLPVADALALREPVPTMLAVTLTWVLLALVVAFLIGNIGLSIGQQVFHETASTAEAVEGFAPGPWQGFWLLLSGAGIAEEVTYRLVLVGLFWRIFKRPGIAVFLAAVLFGLYHITPLSGMYRTFLQFPVSQVLASVLIGLVWGWLFVKRGFGAAVMAHTLSNWVPMLLFM